MAILASFGLLGACADDSPSSSSAGSSGSSPAGSAGRAAALGGGASGSPLAAGGSPVGIGGDAGVAGTGGVAGHGSQGGESGSPAGSGGSGGATGSGGSSSGHAGQSGQAGGSAHAGHGGGGYSGSSPGGGTGGAAGTDGDIAWTSLGDFVAGADATTGDVAIPAAPPGSAIALRADAGDNRCLQVTSFLDASGTDLLAQVGYGAFCSTCPERTEVSVGPSLFVLPTADDARPFPWTVKIGLRDCPTFGSFDGPPGDVIHLSLHAQAPRTKGRIRLRPVRLSGSSFALAPGVLDDTVASLASTLGPLGIDVSSEPICDASAVAGDLAFSDGDHSTLGLAESAAGDLCPRVVGTIPVLFGGCLTLASVTGDTTEVDAFTPHVVGGVVGGVADAVFVKGALCGTPTPIPVAWGPGTYARIIGHEVGHYLGLFHSEEADGTPDLLPDTSADNLMYYRPTTVLSPSFSASQGRVMLRHPSVRD